MLVRHRGRLQVKDQELQFGCISEEDVQLISAIEKGAGNLHLRKILADLDLLHIIPSGQIAQRRLEKVKIAGALNNCYTIEGLIQDDRRLGCHRFEAVFAWDHELVRSAYVPFHIVNLRRAPFLDEYEMCYFVEMVLWKNLNMRFGLAFDRNFSDVLEMVRVTWLADD